MPKRIKWISTRQAVKTFIVCNTQCQLWECQTLVCLSIHQRQFSRNKKFLFEQIFSPLTESLNQLKIFSFNCSIDRSILDTKIYWRVQIKHGLAVQTNRHLRERPARRRNNWRVSWRWGWIANRSDSVGRRSVARVQHHRPRELRLRCEVVGRNSTIAKRPSNVSGGEQSWPRSLARGENFFLYFLLIGVENPYWSLGNSKRCKTVSAIVYYHFDFASVVLLIDTVLLATLIAAQTL